MPRGRKPKPTALKLLDGTRKDRVNASEPAAPAGLPEPPAHLDAAALAEWHRFAPILSGMGVLSPADGPALAVYCVAFSRWVEACNDLAENGYTIRSQRGWKTNPAVAVAAQCEATITRVLAEFGCTPSARSRVKAAEAQRDELGDFLNKKSV